MSFLERTGVPLFLLFVILISIGAYFESSPPIGWRKHPNYSLSYNMRIAALKAGEETHPYAYNISSGSLLCIQWLTTTGSADGITIYVKRANGQYVTPPRAEDFIITRGNSRVFNDFGIYFKSSKPVTIGVRLLSNVRASSCGFTQQRLAGVPR